MRNEKNSDIFIVFYQKKMLGGVVTQELKDVNIFKKGMTLDQYFNEMKAETFCDDEKKEQNLYQTSGNVFQANSKKLITYEIRESDEDNYDQSAEEICHQIAPVPKLPIQNFEADDQNSKPKVVFLQYDWENKNQMTNSRGFRVRRQSNSPFSHLKKDPSSLTPNQNSKNLVKTLYSNQWKMSSKHHFDSPTFGSSTLYGQFLKGIKDKKKEKYFKKKNTRELDYVLSYEKKMNEKYKLTDIRVDGFTDRLHERKNHQKGMK